MIVVLAFLAYPWVAWLLLAYAITPLALLAVPVGLLTGGGFAIWGYALAFTGSLDHDAGVAKPGTLPARSRSAAYPVWDPAWPLYSFRQLDRDIVAALQRPIRVLWHHLRNLRAERHRAISLLPWAPAVFIPAGFCLGLVAGLVVTGLATAIVLEIVLLVPRLLTLAVTGALRAWDAGLRWWRGTAATCTGCGWVAVLPAFACAGDQCRSVHADLRPGLLGVWSRRCGCGTRLPTTITRATRALRPVCVHCTESLPRLTGAVADARIAVSGGPGAGKSWLVRAGAGGLWTGTPVPAVQESLLCVSVRRNSAGPTGVVHLLDLESGLFEPGAENAARWALGTTRRHLLVLDGMLIPEVRHRAGLSTADPLALEIPYLSLVGTLHAAGARAKACSLAVVVSKADLWSADFGELNARGAADPSAVVRSWLRTVRVDNLIRAAERDFGAVRYFLTGRDDEAVRAGGRWSHAGAPIEWLLARHPHGSSRP